MAVIELDQQDNRRTRMASKDELSFAADRLQQMLDYKKSRGDSGRNQRIEQNALKIAINTLRASALMSEENFNGSIEKQP